MFKTIKQAMMLKWLIAGIKEDLIFPLFFSLIDHVAKFSVVQFIITTRVKLFECSFDLFIS